MTTLLAIDSACAACSVALLREGDIIAHQFEEMNRGQAARLVPMVEEVLASGGIKIADLQAIAVTIGPGAFTGIRIGLATARGLGLASDLPVIGITTTETVAAAHRGDGKPLLVALETKRDDIYLDVIGSDGRSDQGPVAVPLEDLADHLPNGPFILCGDGAARLREPLTQMGADFEYREDAGQPQAVWLAKLAAEKLAAMGAESFQQRPAPLYIRPPDVALPKNPVPLR